MSNSNFLQLAIIRKFPIKEISELILSFELIERKKKIQKIIMNLFIDKEGCGFMSRLHNSERETWMISLNNEKILHCAVNCYICGNYKNISSSKSKKTIKEAVNYAYIELNKYTKIELNKMNYENILEQYKTFYLIMLLEKTKINCLCAKQNNRFNEYDEPDEYDEINEYDEYDEYDPDRYEPDNDN
jgi:hypothetical protein